MSDGGFVTEVARDGLQSLERLLVPALIQNHVRNANSRTEDEDIALRRMIANALNSIAIILDLEFGRED